MAIAPWRLTLQPASYNGAGFFMDVDAKNSGRRIALHEYPKRDIPYAEDMGRKAKRFTISGYCIGPDYEAARDALIQQLEALGNGNLVRPTTSMAEVVTVDGYSVTERRERGGYALFEMTFVEAGQNLTPLADTSGQVTQQVNSALGPTALSTAQNTVNFSISPSAGFMGSSDIAALQ